MNILVVGSGGREHAIIKKLRENPKVDRIFALPGNGGIALQAECISVSPTDINSIVEFAKSEDIDYAVIAPDDPLVLGAVDELEKIGIACFGPDKRAAIIEGSKVFAKNLMKKYNIPTAAYEVFDNSSDALEYLNSSPYPCVIKADGLAAGKGVIIAQTPDEAKAAVHCVMEEKSFGESGNSIVIEEFLTGPEVSVLSFTDGKTIVPMISSMDHKRISDGDTGLNTGGMGAIAPNPFYTKETAQICMREIFLPTIAAMNLEGRTFKGCLYFGLMLTKDGPRVIEYNCRFGDPEAQVVLPLLKTDLLTIMMAVSDKKLSDINIEFSDDAACCVILASKGYPRKYSTGYPISIPNELDKEIFIGGAVSDKGILKTSSGRVLGITATASCLEKAVRKAYDISTKINFKDKYLRSDIGKKALEAKVDGSQGLC